MTFFLFHFNEREHWFFDSPIGPTTVLTFGVGKVSRYPRGSFGVKEGCYNCSSGDAVGLLGSPD